MGIFDHPFMSTVWSYTLVVLLIAAVSRKKCAYGMANWLLAGQYLITTGFVTLIVAADIYDGPYFNLFMTCVYCLYYHFIDNTGNRYLSVLSLWVGGFHAALFFGEVMGLQSISVNSYGCAMIVLMTAQIVLAFRGLLYGLNQRIYYANQRRADNDVSNL